MTKQILRAAGLGLVLTASLGAQAHATVLHALTGERKLVAVNIEERTVLGSVIVTGVDSPLTGIDVRPSNGLLYGLFRNGVIATINTDTGLAVPVSNIGDAVPNGPLAVDFNPVADRMRVISSRTGANLRIDVDLGTVTEDLDISGPVPNPFGDAQVRVRAAAYTNSAPGTAPLTTLLYDIDMSPSALYLQIPPNNGTLVPVGAIDLDLGVFGFDIYQDSVNRNRGLILSDSSLIWIDLAGGAVIAVRPLEPSGTTLTPRDIAVLPNPT